MDVLHFLEERTRFIRYYYMVAAKPFCETKRKIEAEEAPYDHPPWNDSGEPAYLSEWSEAENGLKVLGRSCVTMLSGVMHQYFQQWERLLGIKLDANDTKIFKKGILSGYRAVFEYFLKTPWDTGPADLAILEQVILARNSDQHSGHITTLQAEHLARDRTKYGKPFFRQRYPNEDEHTDYIFGNFLVVNEETLFKAIEELEELARWLEPQLQDFRWGRKREPAGSART